MSIAKSNSPIAEKVSSLIEEKGLKKTAVAKRVGLTDTQFCDILKGRRVIRANEIPALAKALDVTPNQLFGIE